VTSIKTVPAKNRLGVIASNGKTNAVIANPNAVVMRMPILLASNSVAGAKIA
jgi:hypothetical protein